MKTKLWIALLLLSIGFPHTAKSQIYVTTKEKCWFLFANTMKDLYVTKFGDVKKSTIPAGKTLEVVEIDTIGYAMYRVKYKNKVGWIHKIKVVDDSYLIKRDTKIRDEFRKYVLEHTVAVGMNEHELFQSIGNPIETRNVVDANGTSATYTYGKKHIQYYYIGFTIHTLKQTDRNMYVHLRNGIVESIVTNSD